jgi:carbonic anhydrase
VRLVNPSHIKEMIHHREWPIYFVTLLGVVFLNLLYGVGLGIGLAIFFLLRRLANIKVFVEEKGERAHVRIEGSMSFIAVPQLAAALAQVPAGRDVDVDLMVDFMDHAAFEALHSWRVSHEKTGGRVDIDELHESWYEAAENGKPMKHKSGMVAATAGDGTSDEDAAHARNRRRPLRPAPAATAPTPRRSGKRVDCWSHRPN